MATDEFIRITNEWRRSDPQPNGGACKKPPVYDYTMSSSVPHFTFEERIQTHQGNMFVSKYSIPTAFKNVVSQPIMCSQCNASDRADKNIRTPKQATHLCIMMNGREFRPVCDDCQCLRAFNYYVCLETCIPFKEIL